MLLVVLLTFCRCFASAVAVDATTMRPYDYTGPGFANRAGGKDERRDRGSRSSLQAPRLPVLLPRYLVTW